MPSTEEAALMDRVYRNHRLRERVAAAIRQRADTAENNIMVLIAETYLDGLRDGAAFGLEAPMREAFTDER